MAEKSRKPLEEGEQKGAAKPKPTAERPMGPPPPEKPQSSQKPKDDE